MVNILEDFEMIERLFAREESVLAEIAAKYKNLWYSVIRQILNSEADVAECTNDVLLAIWNSIPPNRPNRLSAYTCKLARNISINKFKYNNRAKRAPSYIVTVEELEQCIPVGFTEDSLAALEEKKQLQKLLSDFMQRLDPETRILFLRRYFYLESVTDLAKRFGLSENRISVRLFRARKKLHELLTEEDIAL